MPKRYHLTEEVRKEFMPIIEEFLKKVENVTADEIEELDNDYFNLGLSDTKLNPYTLMKLMEEFGYSDEVFEDNGWQLDYWITIKRKGVSFPSTCEKMCIWGTGITFSLTLSVREFM